MQPLVVPKQENCGYIIHRVIELLLFKLIYKNPDFLVKIKNNSFIALFFSEVPACETPVDIAFLADSSGSISRPNFIKEKTFINDVAKSFVIDKARSRAALVLFSNSASVKIRFSDHTTTRSFQVIPNRSIDLLLIV